MAWTEDIRNLAGEELMHLVGAGDPRACGLIYDRHGSAAFSLAFRIAGDRAAAEDITQETFLSIRRTRARYDAARGSVRTWVLSVVHHFAIDGLRHNERHARRRASAEGIEEIHEAVPTVQTRVIELGYFGGFTTSEIAEMLGAPLGTVKGRIRLGLDKLRDELREALA